MRRFDLAKLAIRSAVCSMLLLPLLARAAAPSTQPVTASQINTDENDLVDTSPGTNPTDQPADSQPRPGRGIGNVPPGQGGGPFGRSRPVQRFLFNNITPTDIAEARKFMAEHSPNRLAAVDSLPDNERKRQIEELAAFDYSNWMRLLKTDPELYQVVKSRVETEDEIYGLDTRLRKNPANKSELSSQLHDQVAKLFDLGIDERQIRLNRLEATLNEQKKKLAEDSANRSNLVEERFKSILNEGNKLPLNPGGGGGGRNRAGQRP